MRMSVEVVERKTVNVNVNPADVLEQLKREWLTSVKHAGDYINKDGVWESWYDTGHGSGMYSTHGTATEHEKEIVKAFKLIEDYVKA